nr:MAG TPA: hypothetical protein [Caudoviricetes sp.]
MGIVKHKKAGMCEGIPTIIPTFIKDCHALKRTRTDKK